MIKNIWRYSLNDGECGGIVIACSKEEAESKVKDMYKNTIKNYKHKKELLKIWDAINDEYYNENYPDVLETY